MAEIGKDIVKAKNILEDGGLVAIPTETVYGLAANALNPAAVTKIFTAKQRPWFDPLIVHVPSLIHARPYLTTIPLKASKLAEHFWPGPLTLLLPKADVIPDLVTSGLDRVGIRCPDHPLTLDLLNTLAFPLAAPSANPFGYISPTRASHVNDQLGDSIDYILDGGPCPVGIESTIVGFEGEATLIYRMGGISIESIESTVGAVIATNTSSESPQAPGQLKSHYAPRKRLMLGNMVDLISAFGNEQVGILSWQKIWPGVEEKKQIVLSPSGDLSEAAQRLFLSLRELDRMDVTMILAEEVPDIGLGRAINDRLRRAAVTAEDT